MIITLQNPGLLELDCIKTMGINVKEGENSIGYFGTGLKYAIAVFLREKVNFSLFLGKNQFKFYTEVKNIRGKNFEFCYLEGPYDTVQLGFTTELGKNWELWQAYREIHSNCLDEEGTISLEKLPTKDDSTTFYINYEFPVSEIFLKFNSNKSPVYSDESIEIYDSESNFMYYKGIRAKTLSRKSKFTYNILQHCELTEDRTLSYEFEIKRIINEAILELPTSNSELFFEMIKKRDGYFESDLNMNYNTNTKDPSKEFLDGVKKGLSEKIAIDRSILMYFNNYVEKDKRNRRTRYERFFDNLKDLCNSYNITISEINETNTVDDDGREDSIVICKKIHLSGELIDKGNKFDE